MVNVSDRIMGCRNLVFMLPRSGYESAREVASALARSLKTASGKKRLRVQITIREQHVIQGRERPHWCFLLERTDDKELHRKLVRTLCASVVLAEISHINYCSGCGEYWFEHRRQAEVFRLGSVGAYLCGDVEKISIEHSQQGFSFAQLRKLEEKGFDLLERQERKLEETRLDAVDIGERMFYSVQTTQFFNRAWECWALEQGRAELASQDGEPFIPAQASEFPAALQQLERVIERR